MAQITAYTAPGCAVCQNLKALLNIMSDKGLIDMPKIVDISQANVQIGQYNFRSVPWVKIGHLFFSGMLLQSEILHWIEKHSESTLVKDYLIWQLRKGQLPDAEMTLKHHTVYLHDIVELLLDETVLITTRIGLMALLESFEGSRELHDLYPLIRSGINHSDFRIRTDVCQLLEMSSHPKAVADLIILTQDQHQDVRESATDALIELGELEENATGTLH